MASQMPPSKISSIHPEKLYGELLLEGVSEAARVTMKR